MLPTERPERAHRQLSDERHGNCYVEKHSFRSVTVAEACKKAGLNRATSDYEIFAQKLVSGVGMPIDTLIEELHLPCLTSDEIIRVFPNRRLSDHCSTGSRTAIRIKKQVLRVQHGICDGGTQSSSRWRQRSKRWNGMMGLIAHGRNDYPCSSRILPVAPTR